MKTAIDAHEQPVAIPAVPAQPAPSLVWAPSRRRVLAVVIVLSGVAAAIGVTRAWTMLFVHPPAQLVRASGRIEGREVTLAAKTIQGRVKRLLVDEGDTVTKGQLVAELEAAQVEARVAAARAVVANLDAQLRQASLDVRYTAKNSAASIAAADAALSTAHAHVVRANAIVANANAAFERAQSLFSAGAISQQDLDVANMTLRTSRADVAAAEKDVTRAEANLALARASADTIELQRQKLQALQETRRSAVAQLEEAQANLDERLILAPENGTVISRTAEVGDVVSPGSPIFQVVDMQRLYVKVYIPERDIGRLRLGDPGEVFVDAFPDRSFTARVSRISDQAEFTPKNVETAEERLKLVFGVELALVNPEGLLKPGMPADCVVHWQSAEAGANGHGS